MAYEQACECCTRLKYQQKKGLLCVVKQFYIALQYATIVCHYSDTMTKKNLSKVYKI